MGPLSKDAFGDGMPPYTGVLTPVSAALTSDLPPEAPGEIVYIPDGSHTITPYVNGKPKTVTISIPEGKGEAIAAALQASLQKRQAENVRPHVAFDHKVGKSAGNPESFRYEKGKGIILKLSWSTAGRSAIEGRDYSYFSPSLMIADDGTPHSLPARGEIGSLVNEPAFRTIPRIAASDGEEETPSPTNTMNKVFRALNINAADADAEDAAATKVTDLVTAAKAHTEAIKAKDADIKDLTEKLQAAEAKVEAANKQRADDLVKAAVADGRIAPADEKTKNFWGKMLQAGDADAVSAFESLPKRANPGTPLVTASNQKGKPGEHEFETRAKALVTAKEAEDFDAACLILAAAEPEAYDSYMKDLAH